MSIENFGQDKDPRNYEFSVFLPEPTLVAINEIRQGNPYKRVIGHEIEFLDWSTGMAGMGLDVFGILPDSHVALRFKSPLLEYIRNGHVNTDWVDEVSDFLDSFNEGLGMTLEFNGPLAAYLSRIEQAVGFRSYPVLLNHGAFMLRAVARKASLGMFITALGQNKDYIPWDSPYNNRPGQWSEERMVDSVSDWVDEVVSDPTWTPR